MAISNLGNKLFYAFVVENVSEYTFKYIILH